MGPLYVSTDPAKGEDKTVHLVMSAFRVLGTIPDEYADDKFRVGFLDSDGEKVILTHPELPPLMLDEGEWRRIEPWDED